MSRLSILYVVLLIAGCAQQSESGTERVAADGLVNTDLGLGAKGTIDRMLQIYEAADFYRIAYQVFLENFAANGPVTGQAGFYLQRLEEPASLHKLGLLWWHQPAVLSEIWRRLQKEVGPGQESLQLEALAVAAEITMLTAMQELWLIRVERRMRHNLVRGYLAEHKGDNPYVGLPEQEEEWKKEVAIIVAASRGALDDIQHALPSTGPLPIRAVTRQQSKVTVDIWAGEPVTGGGRSGVTSADQLASAVQFLESKVNGQLQPAESPQCHQAALLWRRMNFELKNSKRTFLQIESAPFGYVVGSPLSAPLLLEEITSDSKKFCSTDVVTPVSILFSLETSDLGCYLAGAKALLAAWEQWFINYLRPAEPADTYPIQAARGQIAIAGSQ